MSLLRHGGIAKEKSINFAHFQVVITCAKGFSKDVIDNMTSSSTAEGKLSVFGYGEFRNHSPKYSNLQAQVYK